MAVVLIEQRAFERALELARHAREIHVGTPTDPMPAAEAELHYGRALWEVEPRRRDEAREHVVAAEAALAGLGKRAIHARDLARGWLRTHPVDPPATKPQ
jgi:hypothetical protein